MFFGFKQFTTFAPPSFFFSLLFSSVLSLCLFVSQTQLENSLQISESTDKEWLSQLNAISSQQISAMKTFEGQCRGKYEKEISDMKKHNDEQVRRESLTGSLKRRREEN